MGVTKALDIYLCLYVGGVVNSSYKSTVHPAVAPFDPESSFNMRAVSLLEAAAGIPVMRILNGYISHIQNILGLTNIPNLQLSTLLNLWTSSDIYHNISPTWNNLLLILRLLSLDDLAQRIETYLIGGLSPTRGKQGERDSISISCSCHHCVLCGVL